MLHVGVAHEWLEFVTFVSVSIKVAGQRQSGISPGIGTRFFKATYMPY